MAVKPSRTRAAKTKAGLGSVDKAEAQGKNRVRKGKAEFVKIGDGESVIVRIYDTSLWHDGFVHPVEHQGKRKSFTVDIMCLDQEEDGTPCPGCADDLDRRFKFWVPVIEREAEKANSQGKVIGYEDKIKVQSGATRLSRAINGKHKRRGINKRDIEISREGDGFETEYEVEWAQDEDSPLTDEDQALIDKSDIDVTKYIHVMDFDSFYDFPYDDDDEDDEDVGEKSKRRGSPFGDRKKGSAKRRRAVEQDEDEDEEAEERPQPRVRRSTNRSKSTAPKVTTRKKLRGK